MINLVMPSRPTENLKRMLACIREQVYEIDLSNDPLPDLTNKKLLFAIEIGSSGFDIPMLKLFESLAEKAPRPLEGSTAAFLVSSSSQLFTKGAASHFIFLANQLGCRFIGHSVVEATNDLSNFQTWQKTTPLSLEEISIQQAQQLVERLQSYQPTTISRPKLVVLHSSSRKTSNTLMLWSMIRDELQGFDIEEIHVENGSVFDCFGCSFKACVNYSLQDSCYYGGVMTEAILPAIENADVIIWICPNYNDSISSNLTAVINRLTTLYRKIKFYDKSIFAVIVSGNSGSDSIAKQLIDSLNINKGFLLPSNFCIMETANDMGTILKVPNIQERAIAFAEVIKKEIKATNL